MRTTSVLFTFIERSPHAGDGRFWDLELQSVAFQETGSAVQQEVLDLCVLVIALDQGVVEFGFGERSAAQAPAGLYGLGFDQGDAVEHVDVVGLAQRAVHVLQSSHLEARGHVLLGALLHHLVHLFQTDGLLAGGMRGFSVFGGRMTVRGLSGHQDQARESKFPHHCDWILGDGTRR